MSFRRHSQRSVIFLIVGFTAVFVLIIVLSVIVDVVVIVDLVNVVAVVVVVVVVVVSFTYIIIFSPYLSHLDSYRMSQT